MLLIINALARFRAFLDFVVFAATAAAAIQRSFVLTLFLFFRTFHFHVKLVTNIRPVHTFPVPSMPYCFKKRKKKK